VKGETYENLFAGAATDMETILAEREERARRQGELLGEFGPPLLCLSLNIPGPRKVFPWARRSFFEGLETLRRSCAAAGISLRYEEIFCGPAGYQGIIAASGEAAGLKAMAIRIEENHPLGRLFDIDVLGGEGKISRVALGGEERKCLVCGDSAFACGRSRSHSLAELNSAVIKIMENFFREKLGNKICGAALEALMGEAAVTPKPGLVDRANNGAHGDMDFFSFIRSTAAILPWFRRCAQAGFESPADPAALFDSLRPEGKIAEALMREAAGGANTHRGLVFSLGLLSAAFGRIYRQDGEPGLEDTLELCRAMTARLDEDFSRIDKANPSHGEALYMQCGCRGARGEAARGFPTVRNFALPVLRELLHAGHSRNDAGAATLLHIIAHTEDTNIIHRSGPETLREIQKNILAFLETNPAMDALLKKAAELDGEFIHRNISPGGSADLLALAFFLDRLIRP
jgi:holo-ACP synthase/triphosphoribosyl-dephospho-CoA synthase